MKDEAAAKKSFRKAVEKCHARTDAFTWTNTDAFRSGLPDFFIAYEGKVIAVETKFIKELPKKDTSLALKHEVSESQIQFMKNIEHSGNKGVILIGLEDCFVYTQDLKKNYSVNEILAMPRIEQSESHGWDLYEFWRDLL